MPIDNLNFSGINRAVSDYGNAGACEELINLRPTLNGIEPVKPFVELFENRGYDKVYVHKAVGSNNYIAIKSGTGMVIVYRVDAESGPVQTLFYFGPPANFSLDDIHFAYTGNYALFSIRDEEDSFYINHAYIYKGDAYEEIDGTPPALDITVNNGGSIDVLISSFGVERPTTQFTRTQAIEKVLTALEEVQEENINNCIGPFILAIAFKTKDGETFWTGDWRVVDPLQSISPGDNDYLYEESDWDWRMEIKRNDYWKKDDGTGQNVFPGEDYSFEIGREGENYRFIARRNVGITIQLLGGAQVGENSFIQSVEVYTSKPAPYINPYLLQDSAKFGYLFRNTDDDEHTNFVFIPKNKFDKMGLDRQLLYLQDSIPISDLNSGYVNVVFEFGGNRQTTNKTLDVDTGRLTRYGALLSYNSRYHFYDSTSKTNIGAPNFCFNDSYDTDSFDVFVRYESNGESGLLYIGNTDLPDGYYDEVDIAIAPSINATEIIATCYKGINERTGEAEYKYYSFPMEKSSTYNYSICTKPIGYIVVASSDSRYTETEEAKTENKQYYISPEPDAINVTEQYNPFVFDVMNSYIAPGKIIDVQPQLVAVRDVSFGDYPLNVFTDRGAYALLQGSGEVLYGNWRSVSNLVSQSNCVPTDSGTFFLAAGSLWLLAGSAAIQVSDALSRGPHKYIRSCEKYALLSKSGTGYDISGYESVVQFDEYTKGAFLSYNIFRDEIFVSNPNYGYSYVISLKYRQWFKVNYQIKQYSIGDNIAMTVDNTIGGTTSNTTWDSYTIKLSLTVRLGEYDTYSYTMNLSPEEQDNPALACENFTSAWQAVHAGTPVEEVELDYLSGLTPGTGSFSVENIPYRPDAAATMWTENDSSVRVEYDFTMRPTFHRVIDLSQELSVVPGSNTTQSVLVHMQSRPFSNGYQYTHVHRIVSMVRAALGQNDKMIVALYGSDDLQNWNLLSYASRANVTVSQIRTASAARSWRYYTICIGGVIPVDTVMGPVLVEQQPVVRRIG